MSPDEAKKVLLTCRPGVVELADPAAAEAMALVRRDPELRQWFERHTEFQRTLQRSFREVPVPPDLARRILAHARPVLEPVSWWRQPVWYAAAAAIVLLFAIALTFVWRPTPNENSLATFRSRMVRSVLRQYVMDIETNDMTQVRRFLASRQAPSDYELPAQLANLPVLGAGVRSWQGERVSMVCLDSAGEGTLFLFVVDQSAVRGRPAPAGPPAYAPESKLMTANWTRGGKTYVLAGSAGRAGLEKHLGKPAN